MAGRIPSQFIDELLNRVDIVEVIDSRVALRKAGREYTACCPFHDEKTPSFTVSPNKQFYHCFGCGAHGSAISFLMEYERMEFVDAVEELASMVGLKVPREAVAQGRQQSNETRDLYHVLELAGDYYRRQLREHAQSPQAVAYLKQRGLTGEIAATFNLGYAPPGWDNLLTYMNGKNIGIKQLLAAGLVIAKDNGGHYDRFRNRIMFPIRDRRGRVIAFGGRALGDDTPKYLNSPETSVFHKGRELYGLYEARKADRQLNRLLVVEGYMDTVSLAQFGVHNVVATLGTATTNEHLEKMFRIVPEVVFCFDGDRAGRQAAWRALENSLPLMHEGRQIKFIFLPEGEDPDTVIRREGESGFQQRLQQAQVFSNFFYETLSKNLELGTIDGRSMLVEKAKPYLMKIPEGIFRYMMIDKLAEISHVESEKLSTLIFSGSNKSTTTYKRANPGRPGPSPVRQMIRLLLEQPSLAELVEVGEIKGLDLAGIPLFIELVENIAINPHINCAGILERWRGSENGRHLAKLAQQPLNISNDGIKEEFLDILQWFKSKRHNQRIEELLQKSQLGTLSAEEKRELKAVLAAKI
ncbi:MAG: DNA primase [Gammaproteobacteria bacterium]|jgi:DNA primase